MLPKNHHGSNNVRKYMIRGDVHTQVVTDNGKRPFGGVGVLHQRVISVTKWHYRNNVAEILIKQVFRKKPRKKALKKLK